MSERGFSPAYEAIKPAVVDHVIPSYETLGAIAFSYAQGSLVEGLATVADLDLVVAWEAEPPPVAARATLALSEGGPEPKYFDEAGFVLDRFWLAGQQIDVKHVAVGEVRSWVERVEDGGGTSGYPMPAVALHGLLTGDVLTDPRGDCQKQQARIQKVPEAFSARTADIFEPEALDGYWENLTACVDRGDGLLFYSLAAELLRRAYIAWFAAQGLYWPHEKRLQARLVGLGRTDLAEGDRRVWSGTMPEAFDALRDQVTRLAGALGIGGPSL